MWRAASRPQSAASAYLCPRSLPPKPDRSVPSLVRMWTYRSRMRLLRLSRYDPRPSVEKLGRGDNLDITERAEAQQRVIPCDNESCFGRDRAFKNSVIVRVAAVGNPFSRFNNGAEPFKAFPNLCDFFT